MVENGWSPNDYSPSGANQGQTDLLYLTSHPDDAEWFAEQKGGSTVLKIEDIPTEYLIPDPEDEPGYDMEDLFKRMENTRMPSKFTLTKSLDPSYFSVYRTKNPMYQKDE